MRAPKITERHLWAAEALLLASAAAAAVWLARPDEWHPLSLVALLIALALAGEWFTVESGAGVVSASLAVLTFRFAPPPPPVSPPPLPPHDVKANALASTRMESQDRTLRFMKTPLSKLPVSE